MRKKYIPCVIGLLILINCKSSQMKSKTSNGFRYLSVNYLYDTQNRLDTITVDSKTFDYEYYNDGMLKAVNYPTLNSGLVLREEFTYDNSNRLKTVINKKGSQIISQYSYTYDDQGNILSVTQNGQTDQYQYDELNRLQSSDKANGNYAAYQYDHRGNRSQSIGDNTAIEAFIPGSFTYDQWENLTQFTANNADNNYSYRPDGLRNQKTTIAGTTKYYLDNNDCVITEANAAGQVTAQNIWGHQALARKVNSAYYYYLYNGHGDVVQMVDEAGNIVNSYEYDEWGNMAGEQEQIPNPIRYAGEYYDAESGLYYLRARYYDPTIGRFIAEDSNEGDVTNPLSLNLYTYCYNNPMVYVDPSGHECGAINIPDKNYNISIKEWADAGLTVITFMSGGGIVKGGAKVTQVVVKGSITGKVANKIRTIGSKVGPGAVKRVLGNSRIVKGTSKLSKSNIKHIGKHIPSEFANQDKYLSANQAKYLSKEALEGKLKKNTFFNPNWSKQQIISAVEEGYNALSKQGLTGLHSYKVNGETIKIFIKADGTFDSAYGLHKLTTGFFGK